MILNIILLVLIAIIFYLILKSVKDRFQNVMCSYKYDKNNKFDCINKCKNSKDPACTPQECNKRCVKLTICNNKNYDKCNFNKCNWSVDRKKCEVPKELYFLKDSQSLSFKKNMKFININRNFDSIVTKPTKYKSSLKMMKFNGRNSVIHIPDCYSKNTMISFFFNFRQNTKINSIPIVSSVYWKVSLEKEKNSSEFKIVVKSSKTGNIAFPDVYYPLNIQPGNLYSLGLIINSENKTATLLVYDLINKDNDVNYEGLKIKNFIYSETPSILVGTNNKRTLFLDGRIGDLKITREISDSSILKRNSFLFSDDEILTLFKKGKVIKVDEVKETQPPSKINFIAKKENTKFVLYWTAPEKGSTSLKYYIIILKDLSNKKYFTYTKRNEKCDECKYKLANLEYDTDYEVGITAINNKGIQKEINFIKLRIEGSSGASNDTSTESEFIFTNDKVVNKVSCNVDGSYTIGKKCSALTSERISSNLDNEDFRKILESLSRQRVLDASVDFKI